MKWSHRLLLIAALLVYGLTGLTPASAEEKDATQVSSKLTYDFDEVKVLYAAEFLAYPIMAPVKSGTTAGTEQTAAEPIHVLYGVVSLGSAGTMKEEFIRVSQGDAYARGLSTGWSWDNYGASDTTDKITTSEFMLGKSLEGKSVVKDYSGGMKMIKLTQTVDTAGEIKDISLSFNWEPSGTWDEFFAKLSGTVYKMDPASLKSVGSQEAGVR